MQQGVLSIHVKSLRLLAAEGNFFIMFNQKNLNKPLQDKLFIINIFTFGIPCVASKALVEIEFLRIKICGQQKDFFPAASQSRSCHTTPTVCDQLKHFALKVKCV